MLCYFSLDIASARLLGFVLYDEWNYLYSIIIICNWIMRFGIDASCRIHIANAIDDVCKQNKYYEAGVKLQILVSIFLIIVLELVSQCGISYLGYPVKYPNLRGLLFLGIIYSGLFSILSCIKESFVGFISFKNLFLVTSIEFLGCTFMGIIGIFMKEEYGLIIGYIVAIIFAIIVSLNIRPIRIKIKHDSEDLKYYKEIIKYALSLLISNIGALVVTEMDTFMLGSMCKGETGIYAVAKNIISKATNIPLAICTVIMVRYAVIRRDEIYQRMKTFKKTITVNFILLLILSVMLIICIPVLLVYMYGDQYEASIRILYILIPYFVLFGLTAFFSTFLSYHKKAGTITLATIFMICTNLALNFILIPKKGEIGAAWASTISMLPYALVLIFSTFLLWRNKIKDIGV